MGALKAGIRSMLRILYIRIEYRSVRIGMYTYMGMGGNRGIPRIFGNSESCSRMVQRSRAQEGLAGAQKRVESA